MVKIRLVSSQTGKETITIHILPNIARVISNQAKKFGPLIEYDMKNIFFKNNAEKKEEQQVPVFFFVFSKRFLCTIVSIFFGRHTYGHTRKTNSITSQTIDPEIILFLILLSIN